MGTPRQLKILRLTTRVVLEIEECIRCFGHHKELCGLLAGRRLRNDRAFTTEVFRLTNLSSREGHFVVRGDEFMESKKQITEQGLSPLAFFHTHPEGPCFPTPRDLKLPLLTCMPSVICAYVAGHLQCICFDVVRGRIKAIRVENPGVHSIRSLLWQ